MLIQAKNNFFPTLANLVMSLAFGVALGVGLFFALSAKANAAEQNFNSSTPWRLRIMEAAVVNGPNVTLGEIATPAGPIDQALWNELAAKELWPAPEQGGRPMNMTRPRLQQAVVESLGQDLARLCLYPSSLALQRGGKVLGPEEIQAVVVNTLTPLLHAMPGEAALQDFRLPDYVFLGHPNQSLELEAPARINPGRLSLRFAVRELDGSVQRRLTGTVLVECWAEVPCTAAPLNRGDLLEHDKITFTRKNLAQLRGNVWDGLGGPWRLTKPVGVDEVIYQTDLATVPAVRKGSTITLTYQAKTLLLSLQVEALSDGVPGETIPVRNLQSKKQLYAVVQDGTNVTINQHPETTAFTSSAPVNGHTR